MPVEVPAVSPAAAASPEATADTTNSGAAAASSASPVAGVPSLDAWKVIMQKGVEFLATNSSPPLGQQDIGAAELGMTDLFETLDSADCAAIDRYWEDELKPELGYMPKAKRKKVMLALKVAYVAHRGQQRRSGEPFVTHPVAVATILAQLKMDCEAVCAGLLHDTVEDTNLTFAQVEAFFGRQVRCIVEGETKVSKLPKIAMSSHADEQAENLRMLFIAMTEDYRIIIVKLADRLHNMRTLKYMAPEKQLQISRETLEIFAPLAHRLGIWQIKSELEDISFMYLYPREYRNLEKRLREREGRYQKALLHSRRALEQKISEDKMLSEQGVNVTVTGRMKELYSLWLKMETKYERKLDRIHDVVALRVIIDSPQPQRPPAGDSAEKEAAAGMQGGEWLCYHVLGLVQHLPGCQPVPSQVKDYISFPKPNGYQSLHTAIMHDGQVVEVQIRTAWMHNIAMYGMASHALYKEQQQLQAAAGQNNAAGTGAAAGSSSGRRQYTIPWFESITEWHSEVKNSREFVTAIRRELLGERVFIFLRDGKILNLSRGATVIDAAFQIHTEVGLTMVGATINGQPAPPSYELKNGDVVSIVTDPKTGRPSPDWLRHAQSRSARARLRAYFRTRQRESLVDAGHLMLDDWLRRYSGLVLEQLGYMPDKVKLAKFVRTRTPDNTLDDFCMHLAHSDDEDVLLMMSKVLNVSPEAIAGFRPHEYWRGQRRELAAGSGSSPAAVNGAAAPAAALNGAAAAAAAAVRASDAALAASASAAAANGAGPSHGFSGWETGLNGLNGAGNPSNAVRGSLAARRAQWGPGVGFLSGQERKPVARVTTAAGQPSELAAAAAAAAAIDSAPPASQGGMRPLRALRAMPRLNGDAAGRRYETAAARSGGGIYGEPLAAPPPLPNGKLNGGVGGGAEGVGGLNGAVKQAAKHYADAELLCPYCMPVRGDEIIGTQEASGEITVHRRGCPEQELQILDFRRNFRAIAKRRRGANANVMAGIPRRGGSLEKVALEWTPWEEAESLYNVEITVYCADRKFLLSDVSNVVSNCCTIVSTASRTLGRDATLSYCVLMRDLDHLQKLIDQVMQVDCVMCCERVWGSEGPQ